MSNVDPVSNLFISPHLLKEMSGIVDDVLYHAALQRDDVVVEAMSKLLARLDAVLYEDAAYDEEDTDIAELDFSESRHV